MSIFRHSRMAYAALSSRPLDPGRLVAVIPPSFRYATGVARFRRSRPAENVPVGDPGGPLVPVRHPVSPGPDDAVERLAGGHQLRTCVGRDDLLDQGVDHRIGDRRDVVRALEAGGFRREECPQLVAGRGGESETFDRDVEIALVDPRLVLDRIKPTDRGGYPESDGT